MTTGAIIAIVVAALIIIALLAFVLPRIPINKRWRLFLNTGDPVINDPGKEPILSDQTMIGLRSRSVAVLVAH